MGIYINGMEMPKTYPVTVTIYPDGRVLSETVGAKDIHGEAVPVPPHGRLVDADALIKVFKTKAKNPLNQETTPYSWAFAYECLADVVGDMPTIIESVEG
jgi:hypothetical protein